LSLSSGHRMLTFGMRGLLRCARIKKLSMSGGRPRASLIETSRLHKEDMRVIGQLEINDRLRVYCDSRDFGDVKPTLRDSSRFPLQVLRTSVLDSFQVGR
jgi:hypothetical protein